MGWPTSNRSAVSDSEEFRRIVGLPVRDWREGWGAPTDEMVVAITEAYRRPGSDMVLRPVQAAMLAEAYDINGGVHLAGVGAGKTLPSFLFARVLDAQRPLLLIPAKLRGKTEREYAKLQQEWVLPRIRIESYEMLGREQNAAMLDNYRPDLIVADEGHKLKNPKAAVTRRVNRYVKEHRPTMIVMSGTLTRRSLMEYWHIMRWCLGDKAMPMPARWQEAVVWADSLDGGDEDGPRTRPGVLGRLCDGGPVHSLDEVRAAYRHRMTSTPGVIATTQSGADCSLLVYAVDANIDHLAPYFKQLREEWETPDGHPFSEAVDLWRHARELACGFYYVWDPRPPEAWLAARRAWCQAVRAILKHAHDIDTELQVVKAIDAGRYPQAADALQQWRAIRGTFEPNVEPRWIDDTVLKIAAKWLHNHVGICWVEHTAFGERLAKMAGVRYYGQGGLSADKHSIEDATGPCIASIAANAEGRNLQRYSRNLVVSCPPNGAVWEQMLGRTHRPGQTADEVESGVILACREQWAGMQRALSDARYIQQTTGAEQKLMIADVDVPSAADVAGFDNPLWS